MLLRDAMQFQTLDVFETVKTHKFNLVHSASRLAQ